jgi:hypothetical protein
MGDELANPGRRRKLDRFVEQRARHAGAPRLARDTDANESSAARFEEQARGADDSTVRLGDEERAVWLRVTRFDVDQVGIGISIDEPEVLAEAVFDQCARRPLITPAENTNGEH